MKTQIKGSSKVKMTHDKAMESFEAARKTTADSIEGAMAWGWQGVNEPPSKDHWLWRFWDYGRSLGNAERALKDKPEDETQKTIGDWADATFGKATDNLSTAIRANAEMAELLTALMNGKTVEEIGLEGADVVIVIERMFESMGISLQHYKNKKMAINRCREWVLDGKGHGQHK